MAVSGRRFHFPQRGVNIKEDFFFHCVTAASGPVPPFYRGFTITLKNTTLGRTPQPDAETSTGKHTTLRRERHS